jgi:GTP-binding protein
LEYPIIYASAKDGWTSYDLEKSGQGVESLLDTIIARIPSPKVDTASDTFKMLISQTESNKFFGRLLIGKIESGEDQ